MIDIAVVIIGLIVIPIIIYSGYKLFTKAGLPAWLAILPLANIFVFVAVAGLRWWWTLLFFVPFVTYALLVSPFFGWIVFAIPFPILLSPLVSLFAYTVVGFSIAKAFGKNRRFGIGVILLPFIFLPLLAIQGSEYSTSISVDRQGLRRSSILIGLVATIYILSFITLDLRGEYKIESDADGYGYWIWRSDYFWVESPPAPLSRKYGETTSLGVIFDPLSLTKMIFFDYYHVTLLAFGSAGDGYSISYPNLELESRDPDARKVLARTSIGASWE